jgi:uncharacterized protein involved in exopolysaccharide biosynthesis
VILPKDSRVIKVSYESTDARLSAMIANTYVSEFIQFNLQRKFESSSYARDFLAINWSRSKRSWKIPSVT